MREKRKYQRISVPFPIECKTLPKRGYFNTVCKDLSLGGAKIVSNEFIPANGLLKVDINLIGASNLKAKVAWCSQDKGSERFSAGLEFIEMNESTRENLSNFLSNIYN